MASEEDLSTSDQDFPTEEVQKTPQPLPEGVVPTYTLELEHNLIRNPTTQLMDYPGDQPRLTLTIRRDQDLASMAVHEVPEMPVKSLRGTKIQKFLDRYSGLKPLCVSSEVREHLRIQTSFTFPPLEVAKRAAS